MRDDEGTVLTVSSLSRGPTGIGRVCMSVPRIVRAEGVEAELWPPLSDKEHAALLASAEVLSRAAEEVGSR